MSFNSFEPPLRILLGPGPSEVHPRVLKAVSNPTLGHLDPLFVGLMDEIKTLLKWAFQTSNKLTFPVSGPGSAGMETCFVNLIEPKDKVIILKNGVFGNRMQENVERFGGVAIPVEYEWGCACDPSKLEDTLKHHRDTKAVAFVHAETSTGALSDAKELCSIAKKYGALTIVDTVTSLGGIPLSVDEWKMDAVYSGSQKCLSCVPGLSPVTFSEEAIQKIKARKTKVPSWFLDLNLVMGYWDGAAQRSYHHTAPVNSLYGLHESLLMLHEEGLEKAWARHRQNHEYLKAGLDDLNLKLYVPEEERLPQLNSVVIPDGVDDQEVRSKLLNEFGLEIGGGLGPLSGKIWRIGLMGQSSHEKNVVFCLSALKEVLS